MFPPEKSWLLADWLRGSFQEKKGPGLPCADEDPCTWAPGVELSSLCSVRYLFSSYIWGLFYSLWRHVLCILCGFSYLIPTALSQFYIWRNGNIDELSNLLKVTQSFSNKPRIKTQGGQPQQPGLMTSTASLSLPLTEVATCWKARVCSNQIDNKLVY